MTQYDYDCLWDQGLFKNQSVRMTKDLSFTYDQIDMSHWLPIENMYQYAKEESGFDFARPGDPHPSTEQHKAMVERVLIPFLLENKMVYDILT